MEQRRVRLGDIVDDYCPRERRVTNHAVVAIIEDGVRQTRCTACETEHPYKGARVPRTRKKTAPAALSPAVVAARGDSEGVAPDASAIRAEADTTAEPTRAAGPGEAPPVEEPAPVAPQPLAAPATGEPAPAGESGANGEPLEDGPVRRPLIRATLPRQEGQPAARPAPEFTMRQSGVRGSRLIENGGRGGDQRPGRAGGNGSRPPQHARHGERPGQGGGHGHGRSRGPHHAGSRSDRPHGHGGRGHRPGQPMRGGKKRSR